MEWFATECGQLLYQCDSGEPQAQIDRESLWRQSRRPDCARQALFLLRQRMGADRAAHRDTHDCSQSGFPAIRIAATSLCIDPFLSADVFAIWEHRRYSDRDTGMPTWRYRGWLREPAERLAFQRRS